MKVPALAFVTLCFLVPRVDAQSALWSQSTDNTTITVGSASCQQPPIGITDNSYWRLYDPAARGVATDYQVEAVRFGIEAAFSGIQRIRVRLHADPSAGAPGPLVDLTELASVDVAVPAVDVSMQAFETVPFDPPVLVPAGTLLAVEVHAFDGRQQGDFFFIGSNVLGETPQSSSYISAPDCGIIDPLPTASVGFPVHYIIDVLAAPARIGTPDPGCVPVPNSSGLAASLFLSGSEVAGDPVGARAIDGPPGAIGFFLSGPNSGSYVVPPGADGPICLTAPVYRYDRAVLGHLFVIDADGVSQSTLGGGANELPTDGSFPTVPGVAPGDTRAFQAWHRDGAQTSNFTDSVRVTFL